MRLWPKHDPDWRPATAAERAGVLHAAAPRPADPSQQLVTATATFCAASVSGRLLFFSDLHWGTTEPAAADRLVAAINAVEADWLVFGGDLISYMFFVPAALAVLARLQARRAKLAVLGNWERSKPWCPLALWHERFAAAGFRLLVNETCSDTNLLFAGYDDLRWGQPDLSLVPLPPPRDRQSGPLVIGIAHEPHTFAHTTGQFAGHLLLSGHTHAGQIRLPGFGALHTSNPYWKHFEHGWYHRPADGAWLHISAGLGATGWHLLRRRICCPPELLLLDFHPPANTLHESH